MLRAQGDAVHDRVRDRGALADVQPAARARRDRRRPAGVHDARRHRGHAARPAADADDGSRSGNGPRRLHRAVRVEPLGDVAGVAERRAVRAGRSDSRPRRRRSTCSRCRSCSSLRGLGQTLVVLAALASGALYLLSGSLTSGFPARLSMTPAARRHLSLLAAGVPAVAGARARGSAGRSSWFAVRRSSTGRAMRT